MKQSRKPRQKYPKLARHDLYQTSFFTGYWGIMDRRTEQFVLSVQEKNGYLAAKVGNQIQQGYTQGKRRPLVYRGSRYVTQKIRSFDGKYFGGPLKWKFPFLRYATDNLVWQYEQYMAILKDPLNTASYDESSVYSEMDTPFKELPRRLVNDLPEELMNENIWLHELNQKDEWTHDEWLKLYNVCRRTVYDLIPIVKKRIKKAKKAAQ